MLVGAKNDKGERLVNLLGTSKDVKGFLTLEDYQPRHLMLLQRLKERVGNLS